jgi:hypothetical protein
VLRRVAQQVDAKVGPLAGTSLDFPDALPRPHRDAAVELGGHARYSRRAVIRSSFKHLLRNDLTHSQVVHVGLAFR